MIRRRGCVSVFALLLALTLVLGCTPKPDGPKKFYAGDICVVRITGERVMVVCAWYYYHSSDRRYRYKCRVGSVRQRRRDGLVSADTEFVAYTLVDFYGFELREEAGR